MELLGIEMSFEEFDRLLCEQSNGKELKVIETGFDEDGNAIKQVVAVEPEPYMPTNQEQIAQLKQQLADMDYKNSKYLDGEYTEEQWAEIQAERKAIREEIRRLEVTEDANI